MITPSDIKDLQIYAIALENEGRHYLSNLILKLLSEFERVNRLGTEVREVNVIFADGTKKTISPKKEVL